MLRALQPNLRSYRIRKWTFFSSSKIRFCWSQVWNIRAIILLLELIASKSVMDGIYFRLSFIRFCILPQPKTTLKIDSFVKRVVLMKCIWKYSTDEWNQILRINICIELFKTDFFIGFTEFRCSVNRLLNGIIDLFDFVSCRKFSAHYAFFE